jgi:UDP-N-acetylmuramate: L-alanyl-gamma-D-glutamyl-meso-diaminopimelate ligase
VFPTYENYVAQFEKFISDLPAHGKLIYCEEDTEVKRVAEKTPTTAFKQAYHTPSFSIHNGVTSIETEWGNYTLKIYGKHNLQNMMAAKYACMEAGIEERAFYEAIQHFKGTAKRLETIKETPQSIIVRDFAHAPSKLKATVNAVKNLYPDKKLIAAYELHTYSSLNKDFLPQYKDTLREADIRAVLFSKHALEMKKMPMLSEEDVAKNFGTDVHVFTDQKELRAFVDGAYTGNENILLMSSGTFDGMNMTF